MKSTAAHSPVMRARHLLLLSPLSLLALPLACGSSSSSGAPGDDGGIDGSAPVTYSPEGCGYSVTQPDSRGATDQALDDGARADLSKQFGAGAK